MLGLVLSIPARALSEDMEAYWPTCARWPAVFEKIVKCDLCHYEIWDYLYNIGRDLGLGVVREFRAAGFRSPVRRPVSGGSWSSWFRCVLCVAVVLRFEVIVRVLVVDSDQEMAKAISEDLSEVGFFVMTVFSGVSAIECHEDADVVIMETSLPDVDGFQLCQRIRSRSHVPIIIHSVQSTEMDRVLGLKLGADDYVTKPCGTWELAARVESVARRTRKTQVKDAAAAARRQIVRVGPLRVDLNQHSVEVDGREVPLTCKEFELLRVLLERPGDVVNRTEIMHRVWGHDGEGDTRTLGVHMVSLRRKLAVPSLIKTVRGVGYRVTD